MKQETFLISKNGTYILMVKYRQLLQMQVEKLMKWSEVTDSLQYPTHCFAPFVPNKLHLRKQINLG